MAAVSQDYSTDSFAAEVKQTIININILQQRNTFNWNEQSRVDRKGRRGRVTLPSSITGSDSGFSFLKRDPIKYESSLFTVVIALRNSALYPN